jgi:hypothetical protein
LQARRHVHPVAEDVVAVDDDVANVHPDTELDALVRWHVPVVIGHRRLELDHTAHGTNDTGELE